MSKQVALILIVTALLGASLFSYLGGNRFALVTQAGDNGSVYKIDERNGRIWWIVGGHAVEIQDYPVRKTPESSEEKAISLAKGYFFPGTSVPMEETILNWLRAKKGNLRVYGWKAKKIDEQTYLVGYTYDGGPGSASDGWAFEVNLDAQIVRDVNSDPALEKKYEELSRSQNKAGAQQQ